MNASDPFADWDAAYVLGALSVADRRVYEEHLADCDRCRDAVSELAGMPGLLAGLSSSEAIALHGQPGPGTPAAGDELPASVARMRPPGRPRHPRLLLIIAVVAALVIGAAAGAVGGYVYRDHQPPSTVRVVFTPLQPSPMSAFADLTRAGQRTKIDINCQYAARSGGTGGGYPGYPGGGPTAGSAGGSADYRLFVIDRSGRRQPVARWTAAPGRHREPTRTIGVPLSQIATLEIDYADTSQTLLRADL